MAAVQRARLLVDTHKWFCAKVAPKKYNDKLQAEFSGPGGLPLQAQAAVLTMTPEQVAAGVRAQWDAAIASMQIAHPGATASDKQLAEAIIASGKELPEELYGILYGKTGKGD
jgi:hypothetical protein